LHNQLGTFPGGTPSDIWVMQNNKHTIKSGLAKSPGESPGESPGPLPNPYIKKKFKKNKRKFYTLPD